MPTQTVIDDEFVTLVYHHEAGIVHHTFHRFVSGDHFRNTLQQGCELLRQNHGTKWLSDDRGNSALTPSDSLWGDTVWAPAVMAAGWKYWAIILPDQHVAQIHLKQWVERYRGRGIDVRLFNDPESALEWLATVEATDFGANEEPAD